MLRLLEYPRLAAGLLGGGALIALIVILVLVFTGGNGGPSVTYPYVSDEAGRYGVYVQPYPGPGRKLQISTGGGSQPVWSRDGKTLYYRSGDRRMAVRVDAETGSAEPPRELLEERLDEGYIYHPRVYDVAIDDSGFIAARAEWDSITRVNVILNWFEELKQRVPTGGQR